jgi:uncharacterized membrane protein YeaQ/YmgE (transglycosylase-associated protein family)
MPDDVLNWIIMILVGSIAGSIAARIMKGDSFGLVVNTILGITGAIVGGFLFNLVNINAGSGIVKIVKNQFNVTLPENIVGMVVAGIVGSIIIIAIAQKIGIGRRSRNNN